MSARRTSRIAGAQCLRLPSTIQTVSRVVNNGPRGRVAGGKRGWKRPTTRDTSKFPSPASHDVTIPHLGQFPNGA